MRNVIRNSLLLSVALPLAYDTGTPGWKMDGDKLALDGDGNPVYINSAGQEQSVKGDTIANLNTEAKNHRTAKEAAEAKLAKYVDKSGKPLDPDKAAQAVATVADIDASKLIDSGKLEELRTQMRNEFTAQLNEKDTALAESNSKVNSLLVDQIFAGSDFVRDQIAVPVDMFKATFEKNFKVEDGKIAAYGKDGNKLLSKKNAGEYADPTEALQMLVDAHPQKDAILKAAPAGGSGNNGGGGGRPASNIIKRSAFDAMPADQQAAIGVKLAAGEVSLAD